MPVAVRLAVAAIVLGWGLMYAYTSVIQVTTNEKMIRIDTIFSSSEFPWAVIESFNAWKIGGRLRLVGGRTSYWLSPQLSRFDELKQMICKHVAKAEDNS